MISKTNRNRKKFVTSIVGLETVPDVKLKVAAKLLGKHFACGASVSETAAGASEIVIQGDVLFDLPEVLVAQLNVRGCRNCTTRIKLVRVCVFVCSCVVGAA